MKIFIKFTSRTVKAVALLLVAVLFTVNLHVNNVAAFYNNDAGNDKRVFTQIQVQLMECNHKDTHYSNGVHINDTTGDKQIRNFPVFPCVMNDYAAGTALYDENKYIYEYEMSYSESQQVDYAVIVHPEITHYSPEKAADKNLVEKHNRMYWVGSYDKSMTALSDVAGDGSSVSDGIIDWWDFKELCSPSNYEYTNGISQQTWETVENMSNQNTRTFIVNSELGDDSGGQRFIYLREGTYLGKYVDGSFVSVDIGDSNHPAHQATGVPGCYGEHISAIIGFIFYHTVQFDANGGEPAEGSVYQIQTYKDSKIGKVYPWYDEASKRTWYSNISVSNPQFSTAYGDVSVKNPVKTSYRFTGWYDTPNGGVMLYDTDGMAVTGTQYFDSNGNWIYKGNVTAYANWEYVGDYTLHYDRGESDTLVAPPADSTVTAGNPAILAHTYLVGSRYTLNYKGNTNNDHSISTSLPSLSGTFKFAGWDVDGMLLQPGDAYSGAGTKAGDVVNAVALYSSHTCRLPKLGSTNYILEGWYESYDRESGTFSDYVGRPGEDYTLDTSGTSYEKTLYAKWLPTGQTLNFDYNIPDKAKNSTLGYVLTGADETSRTVTFGTSIGALPEPELLGYTLSGWSWTADTSGGMASADSLYYGTDNNGNSSDTLYAIWSPAEYEIRYDYGPGNFTLDNPSKAGYYDTVSVEAPAKKGADFAGWAITGMDSSTHLLDGVMTDDTEAAASGAGKSSAEYTGLRAAAGTVTFTAEWTSDSYDIVYDFNGGEAYPGGSYPAQASVLEIFQVTTPEKKGADFKGWTITGMDDDEHLVGNIYKSGTTAYMVGTGKTAGTDFSYQNLRYSSGTVKFTAVWESTYRQVAFITEAGALEDGSITDKHGNWVLRFIKFGDRAFTGTSAYDESWQTKVPYASRTGYTFTGFYTQSEGGEQVFNGIPSTDIEERKVTGSAYWAGNGTWIGPSLILYARFRPKEYTITFDPNGGTWASDGTAEKKTLRVTYDSGRNSILGEDMSTTRTGYIPAGWTTGADGSGYTVYDTDGKCTDEGGFWSEDYAR